MKNADDHDGEQGEAPEKADEDGGGGRNWFRVKAEGERSSKLPTPKAFASRAPSSRETPNAKSQVPMPTDTPYLHEPGKRFGERAHQKFPGAFPGISLGWLEELSMVFVDEPPEKPLWEAAARLRRATL